MHASRVRTTRFISIVVAGLLAFVAIPALRAAAAEITPTNMSVTVDRHSVTTGWQDTVTTDLTFTTPNTAVAGDTLTVTLPEVLTHWPASFQITNGAGGPVVYNVTISDTNPAIATFTLTAAGAAVDNLAVTATFGADVASAPPGTYPLVYKVGSSAEVTAGNLVVNAQPHNVIPTWSSKAGWFFDGSDQCRTKTEECLAYSIGTPAGVSGTATIVDDAGANWEHACTAIIVTVNTFNADGTTTYDRKASINPGDTGYTCSKSQLKIVYNLDSLNLAANQNVNFGFFANALTPGGVGLVKYSNKATVTINDKTETPGRDISSSYVGGTATGDSVSIIKRDEQGHDANTTDEAVDLSSGSTKLVFSIVNNGTTSLTNVKVSDKVTSGSGTVNDLSCDFSPLGGPTSGVTWDGPFASRASFECTATLSGVKGSHTDTATVTATGNGDVSDDDDYNAKNDQMNLVLGKKLTSKGPFKAGDEVTFTLTPSNDHERDALAGWSVTDILPTGLTLTSMSGDGYDCTDNKCVAQDALAAGATGKPITVKAKITASAKGTLRNVAYVSPKDGDVDETNPLVIPKSTTDTDDTPTDNDAQADLTLGDETVTPTTSAPTTSAPSTPTESTPTDDTGSFLADTGSGIGLGSALAAVALVGLGTASVLRKKRLK